MRVRCALFACLLATSTFAADVQLGPSTPLDKTIRRDGPPSVQGSMRMLWSGQKGLAMWADQRGQYPPDVSYLNPVVRPSSVIYYSPMHADGSLEFPGGKPFMNGGSVALAQADDTHFLATVSQSADRVLVFPIDLDGKILADPKFDLYGGSLYSDGKTFLMRSGELYDLDGKPLFRSIMANTNVAALPGLYMTARVQYSGDVISQVMLDNGTFTETKVAKVALDNNGTAVTLGAGDNQVLIVARFPGGVDAFLVDRQGQWRKSIPIYRGSGGIGIERPIWDGSTFLVLLGLENPDGAAIIRGKRVSAAGELLDVYPLEGTPIAPDDAYDVNAIRTSSGVVMRWQDYIFGVASDVSGVFGASNGDIVTSQPAVTPAVVSAAAQTQIRFAPHSSLPVAVWRESARTPRIMLAIGDKTIEVDSSTRSIALRNPAIARNSEQLLVAYRKGADLVARRFSAGGTPLDAAPVRLGNAGVGYIDIPIDAVFDGTSFVVAWSAFDGIYVSRISPNGDVVTISPPKYDCCNWNPRLQATDRGVFLTWSHSLNTRLDILGTRINTHEPVFEVPEPVRISLIGPGAAPPAMAWNDDGEALLAWNEDSCVMGMTLDRNGAVLAGPSMLACDNGKQPVVAWSGSEFVVAWSKLDQFGGVHAMRVDSQLRPIDNDAFEVAAGAYEPSLVQNGSGVTIGYVATGVDDVPRAFFRTLQRLGGTTRGRAAAH